MNILPKKRWHVRTKANIERVRRDEAKAAEEEKECKRRIELAEQEARIGFLRKQCKITFVKGDATPESVGHINFFQDIEDSGGFSSGPNKEHEEEEKARKEKFEKDIGLLSYLGQNSHEAKGEVPWYLKGNLKDSVTSPEKKSEEEDASSKHKSKIDPLNDMKKYLSSREKRNKNIFVYKKPEEAKKDKPYAPQPLSKIEELRAKRMKREALEKKRTQQFLRTVRTGSASAEPYVNPDDRTRRYNSQYNPHLTRHSTMNVAERRVV